MSSEDVLQPRPWTFECPRCCRTGSDPRLTDQSCLICWGEGSFDLNNEAWDGQYRKVVEHLMAHPRWEHEGRRVLSGL